MLKVYADETGIHEGADVVLLSGLIESREYWLKFNREWQSVLTNYDASFFHYREFRKLANTNPNDPYYGWSDEKRRHFIFRLAMIIGESAVPSGGAYAIERNTKLGIEKNPFAEAINAFYKSTIDILDKHWPEYDGRILFIFDKCDKREWTVPLHEIHAEFRSKDSRIGAIAFADDRNPEHLALQAADFSGIHFRNVARQYVETEGHEVDIGIIDFLVNKNVDVMFRNLPRAKTKKLIEEMREHETYARSKGFKGAYYPLQHFPFEEYGYKNKL